MPTDTGRRHTDGRKIYAGPRGGNFVNNADGTKRHLRRQNSDEMMRGYGRSPSRSPRNQNNVFHDAKEHQNGLTGKQYATLQRFGLTGVAAKNAPVIARLEGGTGVMSLFRKPVVDPEAKRAIRMARAIASGKFGTTRRGPKPKPTANWKKVIGPTGSKAAYNRALTAARASGNVARQQALRQAHVARRHEVRATGLAKRQKRKRIRKNTRGGGVRGFDPTKQTNLQRTIGGDVAARRRLLKTTVGHLWQAGENMAAVTFKKPLERVLQEAINARGAEIIAQAVLKRQKMSLQFSAQMKTIVQTAASFSMKGAACALGVGGLVSWAVLPLAWHIGNKAYVAAEKRYIGWVDGLTSKFAGKDIGKLAGTPLGVVLKFAASAGSKVPDCLRSQLIGTVLRAIVNTYVATQVGIELDYTDLSKIMVKHGTAIRGFLVGENVRLHDFVVDLVALVPEDQLEMVLKRANAGFTNFKQTTYRAPMA